MWCITTNGYNCNLSISFFNSFSFDRWLFVLKNKNDWWISCSSLPEITYLFLCNRDGQIRGSYILGVCLWLFWWLNESNIALKRWWCQILQTILKSNKRTIYEHLLYSLVSNVYKVFWFGSLFVCLFVLLRFDFS